MSEPTELNEICITGLGVAACLGLDVETIWQRIQRGECGIGPMPALESPLPPGGDGGQAPDLPKDFWPELPREARYLRWTIDAALKDARINLPPPLGEGRGEGLAQFSDSRSSVSPHPNPLPEGEGTGIAPSRVSLLLGTTLHGMRAGGAFLRTGDYSLLTKFLAGDVARVATQGLAIDGLSATTCSACSSSLGAIALGVTLLESGEADLVIAGGYDAVSEYAYAGFGSLRLISEPPLRPFARGRSGMKVAEGYGIVVLERRADADRRGATIRAIVAGWGESADAFHLTRPHPEGVGALAAMRQAIDRAGIRPAQLDMIAAHATGTVENDNSEAAAITELLGDNSREVPVVGMKSHLGHTLGGAGAVELALSAMAIREGVVPPTAGGGEVEYDAINVTSEPIERDVRFTLNTSLGFGGANTCVVLRSPPTPTAVRSDRASGVEVARVECVDRASRSDRTAVGAVGSSDVVITGIGALLPGPIGSDAFASLLRDRSPITQRTIADAEFESLVPNARRLRRMSTYVKLSIAAATMAVREAKLLDAPDLLRTTGAILGTTHGSAGYCYEYYEQVVREGMAAANPMLFAEGVPNAAAAQLSLTLGLAGACQTIVGTYTAGLDALHLAALRIASGATERIIVCAAEESHAVLDAAYAACGRGPSVSLAVAFVLESSESARARGVTPRAKIGSEPFTAQAATASSHNRGIVPSPVNFAGGSAFSVEPFLAIAHALLHPAGAGSGFTAPLLENGRRTTVAIDPL